MVKMRKMNRKGISHLEVILSLVIFVGFTLFLLVIINPFNTTKSRYVTLDTMERGIGLETNIELSQITLSLNKDVTGCFGVELPLEDNVIAKNENDIRFGAKRIGNKIYIAPDGKFYTVYSSREFEENDPGTNCINLVIGDYNLGLLRNYSVTSFSKVESLKEKYDSDYENLKKELGISTSDFSFIIMDTQGNEIIKATRSRATKINVDVRNVPVQLVYKNGTIKYVMLNIQTW